MSLQYWFPLTEDLHNQGVASLSNINVTAATTIATNGKLGGCYTNTGTTANIANAAPFSAEKFSACAWVRINTSRTNWCRAFGMAGTGTYFGFGCEHSNGTLLGFHFYKTIDGTNTAIFDDYPVTKQIGVWVHYTMTYDGVHAYFYENGTLIKTYNVASARQNIKCEMTTLYLFGGTSGNYSQCSLNDVRIYDHCLSAEEVREIANGLVLHYTLNDDDFEATTNISTGTLGSSAYNGATGKYSYGTTTDMYKTTGEFQGRQCTKVYMGTNNLSAYPYVWFDNLHPAQNAYKTLSFDYYPTALTSVIFYTYNGSATATYKVNGTSGTGGTIPVQVNEWNHIELTLLGTSANTSGWGYMRIGSAAHTSSTSNYWLFDNIQIEEKDHATAYVVGSRTAGNITDNSGYHHHGTITGNIVSVSSTPKYNNSIQLTDSASSIAIGNLSTYVPEGNFTFNIWFKKITDEWSTKSWETILGGPSGFELEGKLSSTTKTYIHPYSWGGGSTSNPNTYSIEYTLDTWNMLTMVRTTNNSKFYLNGELKVTGNAGNIPSGNYFIGAWNSATGQNYRGYFSDARIYCTALPDTEILKLYNSGMIFDKGGSIHTHQFNEYSTTASLEKTAILNGTGFDEIAMCQYDSKIYQEPDGSKWIRIFHHNDPTTSGYFTQNSDWTNGVYKSANAWYDIERVLTYRSSKYYEFMVKQKTTSGATETKYRWSQVADPLTATYNDVKPGTVIFNTSTGYTNSTYGGLYKMNSYSRMNIANATNGNWYGAMGSWSTYNTNNVPGFPNSNISTGYMDLYLRVDIDLRKDKVWQSLQLIEK